MSSEKICNVHMKTPTVEFCFSVNILFFTKIESHCSCLPVTFKTLFNKGATNKTKFWLIVTFLLVFETQLFIGKEIYHS